MVQSKKIPHGYQKTHTKDRMAKYDPENAQAWAVIMDKIRQEYASDSTQLSIAKKLGVTKVAVSRWLSQDRGGERTTFGDMVRYAKALGIPYDELIADQPQQNVDPETAQAWTIVMERILSLREEGQTLEAIGKLMNVGRAAVSRWISGDVGGEKTTYGDMLRYARALGISQEELSGKPSEMPSITPYDKAVGNILEEFTADNGLTADDISKKTSISVTTIHSIFVGETAITASMLYDICSALEVGASMVLNRAARQIKEG